MSAVESPPKRSLSPPAGTTRQRSDFELEPNPFEQSFSRGSASAQPQDDDEQNSKSNNQSQAQNNNAGAGAGRSTSPSPESSKPTLPPLSSLASPSDAWGFSATLTGSLRAGPLSPAMLAGPQNLANNSTSHLAHHHPSFDPASSTFRTGLTPGTGLTPLVAGPASFPPPSPNTAAFIAMVTNAGHGSFPGSSATITPNTLNAITGVLNAATATTAPPHTLSNNPAGNAPQSYDPRTAQQAYANYTMQPTAATAQANGLFLLSQAQQEIEEQARAAAGTNKGGLANGMPNANGTTNGNAVMNGKRTSKRKSTDGVPATGGQVSAPKRTRTTSKRGKKDSTPSADSIDDEDSGDDYDMIDNPGSKAGKGGNKKFETDEEKRKNFLERNRQAALKCRQRKKAWLASLQQKVEVLTAENARLTDALISSREEITRLSALVGGAVSQTGVLQGPGGMAPAVMNPPTNKAGLVGGQDLTGQQAKVAMRAYGY